MLCFRCGSYNPDDGVHCTVCGQDLSDKQGGGKSTANRRPPTGTHQALIFAPGELVAGRYKIIDLVGQGGVGAVYRARDTEVDVDVALKGISPNLLQTEEEQKQFSKAIKAARKLQHANIVRIYDEGHHGSPNRRFFTMKLLEGLTLRKIIRLRHDKGQAFSPEELIPIFQQLGAALDYAHKQTWHGDLKPENVVVLPDLLKVTDFSLVKGLPLKPFLGIAKSRSKGFPYIAPELRVEAQSIDGRVDVYSLGVILAEMLTGLVYEGHFSRAFTAALEGLPTRLDGLIRRALAEHPDGRYARASEMAKDVEAALNALGGQPLPLPVAAGDANRPILGKPPTAPPPAPNAAGGAAARPASPPSTNASTLPPKSPPPPPPNETNPSQSIPGAALLSNPEDDPSLMEIGQSQVLLLESKIHDANSRVVRDEQKAAGAGGKKEALASDDVDLAARRLMGLGSNPDDTVDDPTLRGGNTASAADDIDTNPGGRPVKGAARTTDRNDRNRPGLVSSGGPPGPDELMESLYSDEGDDKLIPPPLPDDDSPLEKSHFPLPGDEDVPTVENRMIGGGRAPVAAASSAPSSEARPSSRGLTHTGAPSTETGASLDETSELRLNDDSVSSISGVSELSAADALGLTSDEPPLDASLSSSSPSLPAKPKSENGLAIHDALTALKLHPRPDLVEDPDLRDALTRTAGTGAGSRGGDDDDVIDADELPPALPGDLDDDSLKETMTGGPLSREPTHLGELDMVPPPVVAPPLRPVSPPRKPGGKGGPSPIAIAAGVGVVVLVALLGARQLMKKPGDVEDGATVTLHPNDPKPPSDGTPSDGSVAAAVVDAGVIAAVVDAGSAVAVVAPPNPTTTSTPKDDKKEREEAEKRLQEEMARREREEAAALAAKTKTDKPETPTKTDKPDDKGATTVAMSSGGECPQGMAKIEAGSFTFGSSGSDPMRNFGEADASTVEVKAYCIDYYEAPNGSKALPTTGVSWAAAKNACDRSGKRLCSEQEWERACKGPNSSRFPYGNTYDADVCNTEDADGKPRPLAAPVDFKKCRSGFKTYMMAGNVEEWVADSVGGQKIAKGGSADRPDFASRCSARRALSAKTSSATLGYRCCADPK